MVIDLVIYVYTNNQMLVGVYLDPRRASSTSNLGQTVESGGVSLEKLSLGSSQGCIQRELPRDSFPMLSRGFSTVCQTLLTP